MVDKIPMQYITIVKWLERLMALAVLGSVVVYGIASGQILASMDWKSSETFYELIYRVLLLVIGLELVRMLVAHDLMVVLELLAFVAARKVLKPDISALDILLVVVAFIALLAARWYFPNVRSTQEPDEQKHKTQHS